MKRPSSSDRAKARRSRESVRPAGLRQVRAWVYDRKSPGFLDDCRRQSLLVSKLDAALDLEQLLDESLREIDGWTA